MTLDARIEALLFFKAEPVSLENLGKILNVTSDSLLAALSELEAKLKDRGLQLVYSGGAVMLGTSGEASEMIEALTKEELNKDLGKAGLETLTIVLYKGPLTRAEIDFIRGVNSAFILRHLLVRGLIDRIANPNDQRSYLYEASFDLLSLLGVSKKEDLPWYAKFREDIENYKKENIDASSENVEINDETPAESNTENEVVFDAQEGSTEEDLP